MTELEYNNKRYRCIQPRAKDMPIYCGRWECFYERGNKWVEVLNYEIKSKLNRIVDKQKKKSINNNMSVNLKKLETMIDNALEKATPESLNEFFNKEEAKSITTILENEPLAALCFAAAIKSLYHDIEVDNNDHLVRLFPENIPLGEIRNCIERICKELHPFDTSDELKEICTLHALNSLVGFYKRPPSTFKDLQGKHKKEYQEYFNLFYCEMRATLQRINRLPRKENKDDTHSHLMELACELGDYLLIEEHNCLLDNLLKPQEYKYKENEHLTEYLNENIQDKFNDNYDKLMNKLCIILRFDHDEEDNSK